MTTTAQMDLPPDEELDDLLPEELQQAAPTASSGKKKAVALVRTKAQVEAAERASEKARLDAQVKQDAVRLAQIVNLHLAGFSLADIGAQIGATADEVDRMLTQDAARYVRNQPALRAYVRNWVSSKYMTMIEADWPEASDPNAKERLENQDRVMRMLDRMAKLHGAEVPSQSEVKVDAAPEAVERLVAALAAGQGLGYDANIFDVVDADVVEDAVTESARALEVSGNHAAQPQEGEPDDGF